MGEAGGSSLQIDKSFSKERARPTRSGSVVLELITKSSIWVLKGQILGFLRKILFTRSRVGPHTFCF